MGVMVSLSYNKLSSILDFGSIGEIISLFIAIIIGCLIYGILIILLRVDEIDNIIINIKDKFYRGNSKIFLRNIN